MKNDFKVGNRVIIHKWNDIEKGLAHDWLLNINYLFLSHLCGRTATITDIDGENVKLNFDDTSGIIYDGYYSTEIMDKI